MPGGDIAEKLAVGAQGLGAGLTAWFIWKILGLLLPYLTQRADARQTRLDRQQDRLDRRYDARLAALERSEENSRVERNQLLRQLAEVQDQLRIVAAELAIKDPANPKLAGVAAALRRSITILPPDDPELDDILGRAK